MKKNNSVERVNDFVSESGSGLKKLFRGVLQADGTIELVEEDKPLDLYSSIQSYKDSVDINLIVSRYINGDIDVLNQREAVFQDVSNLPKNRAQLLQTVIDARDVFDRLPVSIKNNFNNSFEVWFNNFGSEEFNTLMKVNSQVTDTDVSAEEVKDNES